MTFCLANAPGAWTLRLALARPSGSTKHVEEIHATLKRLVGSGSLDETAPVLHTQPRRQTEAAPADQPPTSKPKGKTVEDSLIVLQEGGS